MANVNGIIGYNKQGSSNNKLLAAYGNDIVNLATGLGYGLNLTAANKVRFALFLDRVFFQNYSERSKTFDGNSWTTRNVSRTPISKYLRPYKNRMFLGNCKLINPQAPEDDIGTLNFPSRVFYSDPGQGANAYAPLTWGIEWGQGGQTTAGSNVFRLGSSVPQVSDFKAANIKVGDPLFITNGPASSIEQLRQKVYSVSTVGNLRLTISDNFPIGETDLHFWVGSNWFDVGTDDGDSITGFGENATRLLIFKLFSLWYYTSSQLVQVKGAVGTSSQESVINDQRGSTYYFHGSDLKKTGIYRYDGVQAIKISRAIDPFIQGMSSSNFTEVIAWEEGDELRFYLGNLSNNNENISMTNAVATLNTVTGAWDVSPIDDVITAATKWVVNNIQSTYCGTNDNQVLKMDTGYNYNGTPIASVLETKVLYPSGSEIISNIPYVQVISSNARGVRVSYKLWNNPEAVDDRWTPLGEIKNDKTEFEPPTKHRDAAGIQFRFEEDGSLENNWIIEKLSFFYKPDRSRLL